MTITAELQYPGTTMLEHVQALQKSMRDAEPWSTTFLFHEPGCEAVGQGTPLAKAIQAANQNSFRIWAQSWIEPHLADLKVLSAAESSAYELVVALEAVRVLYASTAAQGANAADTKAAFAEAAKRATAAITKMRMFGA